MTVKQLIDYLEKCNPDMNVVAVDDKSSMCYEVIDISIASMLSRVKPEKGDHVPSYEGNASFVLGIFVKFGHWDSEGIQKKNKER